MLLRKEQWLEVGAVSIDDEEFETIDIGAMEMELLLPQAKERIRGKARLDNDYRKICQQVTTE